MTQEAAIRAVGARLRGREDEHGAAFAARILDEVPDYRGYSADVRDDLRAGATRTAGLLTEAFAEHRSLRREDLGEMLEMSARRVHQGVSLEAYLHAYRAALLAFWDACAQIATTIEASREETLAIARFAIEQLDLLTTQAAAAYVREEGRMRMRSGRQSRDLVERLIAGEIDPSRRQPAAPRLDPTGPLLTIVGRPVTDREEALQQASHALTERLTHGRATPLVAVRHGEVVAICAHRPTLDVRAELSAGAGEVRFGFSRPGAGFAAVPQAYADATLAVAYADDARPVISLDELSALQVALVDADLTARQVITAKGRALLELDDAEQAQIAETIGAFAAADLSVSATATALGVHPNTVRYRLSRITDLTGHDPRTFTGLVELTCILAARRS
jgi:hypothetical protein